EAYTHLLRQARRDHLIRSLQISFQLAFLQCRQPLQLHPLIARHVWRLDDALLFGEDGKAGFAGLERQSRFRIAVTADDGEDFSADLVDLVIAPLHDHCCVLQRFQKFFDLFVGHLRGSASPSARRARARWSSVICRETSPIAIAKTAASSVKPRPAMKSGM